MKKCGLYDENGIVVNTIVIKDGDEYEPPEGLSIVDDENAQIGYSVVDGNVLIPEPEPIPEPTYQEMRYLEYPDKGDQLDEIWKQLEAMRNDGLVLEKGADEMLNKIIGVKEKYPKK